MEKIIYKYNINKYGYTHISVPEGAEVLSAQLQHSDLVVWIMHDNSFNSSFKEFYTTYTNEPFSTLDKKHINTIQDSDGIVLHVFEIIEN